MTLDARQATIAGLRQLGLVEANAPVDLVPLTGGVASDIWVVQSGPRRFVVKRALEKLRVAADWRAPVSRNASEVAWLKFATSAAPNAVPRVLAHSPELGFFAMDFLDPPTHPVWKQELRAGRVDPSFARKVGTTLAAIHASTADLLTIAGEFNDDALFRALRIEPYLEFTASRHPEIAEPLLALGARTLATHRSLVHGDISPKNILAGPTGPVFLDAECAWYGDPAFDLAFCLNHLLLKCLWTPAAASGFLAGFDALAEGYLQNVRWEEAPALEARAAALLPALLLARIDGKSPVEYLTDEETKSFVRRFAVPFIKGSPRDLATIRSAWAQSLVELGVLA
ncbi:MAG TPA: aminoglycoside phosphotransferase family protein [Devosia sp.]|jgi:aminoglycoside phosphotransferase (APT) family kinase protein|uniref:phosphotransferase family protein n=1 Tax=Devosia sp. TaxID=1871048 RepID=UPI002DDCBACE|nr:aminoglycoside phosphotransferase family protein [Devosia sp.]HEV2514345.1 aminoglycoside phosphotransferase family protein [Devosia sp.]